MSGKYSKFDSFLKRTLDNKEYKEVKIYEPCVTTCSREKHAFRFTFITRDKICITENPPKSLLYWVHLKYVVAVFMLNDKAKFLQAELRDCVQHVVIKFVSNSEGNLKSQKPSKTGQADFDTLSQSSSTMSAYNPSSHFSKAPDAEAESSTSGSSGPLLCSFANLASVEESRSLSSERNLKGNYEKQHSKKILNFSDSQAGNAHVRSPRKASAVTSRIPTDPYSIQVLEINGSASSQSIEELHLYILNENTLFLPMLQSAWKNWIIFHSFPQGQENMQPDGLSTLSFEQTLSPSKHVSVDNNTRTLFAGLKQELQFASDIEQIYGLYNELKTGATQDILIKLLFWKDEILLRQSINLIKKYLCESCSVSIDERADEIELSILILETTALMLRETEAIPQCYIVLRNLSQNHFNEVLDSLLCVPKMYSANWYDDLSIGLLLIECTVAACGVLYELINAAQQMSWILTGKSSVFNPGVLMEAIDSNKHLGGFLTKLMSACIHIWDPHAKNQRARPANASVRKQRGAESFTPDNAVKAFHLFTIFHRIIMGSNAASQYVKTNFKEEFKYYIRPTSVGVKFPPEYPISAMGRAVVQAVGALITGSG